MNKIIGIGANVEDSLITLADYPAEDTKVRADSICVRGGGPCATGLVAASKLGAECAYIGVLADDATGHFLADDLKKYGVSDEYIEFIGGRSSFKSCVLLNLKTASRTCLFNRGNLPPLTLSDKQKNAIAASGILMVDGNELSAAVEAAKAARKAGAMVLYDAGGLYEGIEKLLPYADILIPSEEFALKYTGADSVVQAAERLYNKYSPRVVVITCGKRGEIGFDGKENWEYPAFSVDAVDTNGAGDVFHGAFAFALTRGYSYRDCCVFSSAVSAIKCRGTGARESTPGFAETIKFLMERGYHEF